MQSMKLEQGLGLLFSNHKGSTSACLFKVIILMSLFHSTIKIKVDNTHIKIAILIFYEHTIFPPKNIYLCFYFILITKDYFLCTVVATQWNSDGGSKQSQVLPVIKVFSLEKNSSTGSTWRQQYTSSSTYRPTRRNRLVACCSEIIRRGKNKKKFMLRIYPVSQCFFDCFSKLFLNVSGIPNRCMLTRTSLTLP